MSKLSIKPRYNINTKFITNNQLTLEEDNENSAKNNPRLKIEGSLNGLQANPDIITIDDRNHQIKCQDLQSITI